MTAGHLCCAKGVVVVLCQFSLLLRVHIRMGSTTRSQGLRHNLLVVGPRAARMGVDIPFVARAMVVLLEQLSLLGWSFFRAQQLTNSWFQSAAY